MRLANQPAKEPQGLMGEKGCERLLEQKVNNVMGVDNRPLQWRGQGALV
jgi:hypothetical protein